MPRDRQTVLVLPAERDLCPYVELYVDLLKKQDKPYLIIQWDRLGRMRPEKHRYASHKKAAQMNFFDYLGYGFFVKNIFRTTDIEAVVVFSLPLVFSLKIIGALRSLYYGIDIRDYHHSYRLPFTKSAVQQAKFCALSSPGFASWLQPDVDYVISHNYRRPQGGNLRLDRQRGACSYRRNSKVIVGTIGQLKDLGANQLLLHNLGGRNGYEVIYHGEGVIEGDLKEICRTNNYLNVTFTGRYKPNDESALYSQCDVISMLMTAGNLNNDSLLANRVYNSMLHGVPQVVFEGTYLADVVEKFDLGIVIREPTQLRALDALLDVFHQDFKKFQMGRVRFQEWIENHQIQFENDFFCFLSRSPARLRYSNES